MAYLILAHKDPTFIERLAKRLIFNCENECYIHVDAKTDEFNALMAESDNPHVHWLKNRVPVYWAGYNSIIATLKLFEEASKSGFDRYMILQGADYPLYSNKYINNFFETHSDVEFIRAVDESAGSKTEWHKYIPKNYLDRPNYIKRAINKANAVYWQSPLPKFHKKCVIAYDGTEHHIYRGWAQIALGHEAVEYVLKFAREHDEFNNFFRHVYAADESYFHTIIYNSPFREKTVDGKPVPEEEKSIEAMLNLTYFEYPTTVRVFKDADDYPYLMQKEGYLFFRKASSQSKPLLDLIDKKTYEDEE